MMSVFRQGAFIAGFITILFKKFITVKRFISLTVRREERYKKGAELFKRSTAAKKWQP